jgi:capsule polysaccharide export protein KpsE/RkpR
MQVVLISPYSNRNWTVDDQAYLTGIARPMVLILYRIMLITRLQDELLTAQQELQEAQELQKQAEESSRGLMEMVNVLQKQIDGQHPHGKKQEGGASTSENRQVDEQNPSSSVESQFESKNLAT